MSANVTRFDVILWEISGKRKELFDEFCFENLLDCLEIVLGNKSNISDIFKLEINPIQPSQSSAKQHMPE